MQISPFGLNNSKGSFLDSFSFSTKSKSVMMMMVNEAITLSQSEKL
jgi:hypothetical protein